MQKIKNLAMGITLALTVINIASGQNLQEQIVKLKGDVEVRGSIIFQDEEYILVQQATGYRHQYSKRDVIWIRENARDVTHRYLSAAQLAQRPDSDSAGPNIPPQPKKVRPQRPKDGKYYAAQFLGSTIIGAVTVIVGVNPLIAIVNSYESAAFGTGMVGLWSFGAAYGAHLVAKRFGQTGSIRKAMLGAAVGLVITGALGTTGSPIDDSPIIPAMALTLPFGGAVVGYNHSSTPK